MGKQATSNDTRRPKKPKSALVVGFGLGVDASAAIVLSI
jgi:hypothetical protein